MMWNSEYAIFAKILHINYTGKGLAFGVYEISFKW